jgi:hypothetical protein
MKDKKPILFWLIICPLFIAGMAGSFLVGQKSKK